MLGICSISKPNGASGAVLACERFGLSGLDDSALSSAPSSPHHLHNERRHLDTALAGAAFEPPHSLCHLRNLDCVDPDSRPSSLSCPGKKAVSNNLPTPCRPTTMPTSLPILLTIFLEPPVS